MSVIPENISDEEWSAARRLAEAVNIHVLALEAEGDGRATAGYVAIRLEDGRSPDGILYDTRRAAAEHQQDPYTCFIKVGRDSISDREALLVLMAHRAGKARGVVFHDEEIVVPQRLELAQPYTPRTVRALMEENRRGR